MSKLRKLHEVSHTTGAGTVHTAKVYRDAENDEFVSRFYINGKHNPSADYFTNDKADAVGTADWHINRLAKQFA